MVWTYPCPCEGAWPVVDLIEATIAVELEDEQVIGLTSEPD
jgi:hypothetical protein